MEEQNTETPQKKQTLYNLFDDYDNEDLFCDENDEQTQTSIDPNDYSVDPYEDEEFEEQELPSQTATPFESLEI